MALKEEPVDYNKKYGIESQEVFFSFLMSDPEIFARVRSILSEDYFHPTLRGAIRFVLKHADDYRSLPAVEMISAQTGVIVQKFSESTVEHHAWFLKEIEGFCRYKALENIVIESVDLLQKGQGAEIERRAKEAMTISLVSDLGTEYFEDPKARLERMRDHSSYVSTGWSAIDRKLYGGFTRGALNVFAGGSGCVVAGTKVRVIRLKNI